MIPILFKNENAFNKDFEKASKKTGIPVSVLKGFAGAESAFNAMASKYEPHRKDYSRGLLQLLETTARLLGFKGRDNELFEPYTSIYYGGKFIKELSKQYSSLSDIVASYNMGYPRKAKNTTQIIIKIYGKPKSDWKYANQPYVDRVLSYIAFYQAVENKNFPLAWKIRKLIYNKRYDLAKKYASNPFGWWAFVKKYKYPLLVGGVWVYFYVKNQKVREITNKGGKRVLTYAGKKLYNI